MTTPDGSTIYDSDHLSPPIRGAFVRLRAHRGLLALLVSRDVTVRYKRSVLGVWWTLFNPLLTTAVMWVVFSAIFRFEIPGNVPFVVYLLSGVLLVTLFTQAVLATGTSITANAPVLTKVFVPPEVFSVAAALGAAVNFAIGFVVLLIVQLGSGVGIPLTAVLALLPAMALVLFALGFGLMMATVAVRFDDVVPTVGVLLTIIGYATPTFYPISIVPEEYRIALLLNPVVAYLDTFRDLVYLGELGSPLNWLIIAITSIGTLLLGMSVFSRSWRVTAVML